ncbi:MAG: hypothetical protein WC533_00350 [Candidatus Pacearchaeota archaeon]
MKAKKIKAQEEMVGFVLIVVLVAIVGIVLLGIYLRKPNSTTIQESNELSAFLTGIKPVTTGCERLGSFQTIESLVDLCYRRQSCENGEDTCKYLENTIKEILNNSFDVGEESYRRYYEMKLYTGSEEKTDIISPIFAGKGPATFCPSTKMFGKNTFYIGSSSEVATMRVEMCYNLS